jgi:hypothetical protein
VAAVQLETEGSWNAVSAHTRLMVIVGGSRDVPPNAAATSVRRRQVERNVQLDACLRRHRPIQRNRPQLWLGSGVDDGGTAGPACKGLVTKRTARRRTSFRRRPHLSRQAIGAAGGHRRDARLRTFVLLPSHACARRPSIGVPLVRVARSHQSSFNAHPRAAAARVRWGSPTAAASAMSEAHRPCSSSSFLPHSHLSSQTHALLCCVARPTCRRRCGGSQHHERLQSIPR